MRFPTQLVATIVAVSCGAFMTTSCGTTQAATKDATNEGSSAPSVAAEKAEKKNAGEGERNRAGAITYLMPEGFRLAGPDDATASQTEGKRRVAILVPNAWPARATTPPKRFYVLNTATDYFDPLNADTCAAVAASEAKKLGTTATDPRFVQTPIGPACYYIDQPARPTQYMGFIVAAGRIVSVISAGTTGVSAAEYEALLTSIDIPDPKLVVGNHLDGQLPEGFSLVENKDIDAMGGMYIQKNRTGLRGEKYVRATIFAFPLPMHVPLDEWKKPGTCDDFGKSNADSKKKTLKSAGPYPHSRGTTCEAIAVHPSNPTVLDRSYVVPFEDTIVGITCNYTNDDTEMKQACETYGETIKVVEPTPTKTEPIP